MTFFAPPPETTSDDNYAGYIEWKAQGSDQLGIPAISFALRQDGVTREFIEIKNGVVWDVENVETGWQRWPSGGQKEQVANPAVHKPIPAPGSMDEWKKYLKMPIALDPNTVVLWDQASVGSWSGFNNIAPVIAQQIQSNPGCLPVIQYTGQVDVYETKHANAVKSPQFLILQWVPRPGCLIKQEVVPPAPLQQPIPPAPVPPAPPAPAPAPQPAAAWGTQPAAAQPAPPPAPAGAWNT